MCLACMLFARQEKPMSDTAPAPLNPAAVVDEYLRLLMIPDPAAALCFVGPMRNRFHRRPRDARSGQCAAFNATRYKWVQKRAPKWWSGEPCGSGVLQLGGPTARLARWHAVRRQPLCRPLRGGSRADRADGCLERQRRVAFGAWLMPYAAPRCGQAAPVWRVHPALCIRCGPALELPSPQPDARITLGETGNRVGAWRCLEL